MSASSQSIEGEVAKVRSWVERGNISQSCFVWWQLSAAASLIIAARGPMLLLQACIDNPIHAFSHGSCCLLLCSCWDNTCFYLIWKHSCFCQVLTCNSLAKCALFKWLKVCTLHTMSMWACILNGFECTLFICSCGSHGCHSVACAARFLNVQYTGSHQSHFLSSVKM